MSDLMQAVATVAAKAPEYAKGDRVYRGEISEVFSSNLIKKIVGDSGKEFRVNLAGRVVNAVLDRLKIASISVPNDDAATARLVDLWDRNGMGRSTKTLLRTALSQGDSYLFIWGDPDDDQGADILVRQPATTRVFYDPENPNRKTYASFVWTVGSGDDERIRVNLLYADRIERFISRKGTKGERDADFDQYLDDDQGDWLIENPYGEVPVFHFRTDEPYGRPEHVDAFGPQNIINKLVAVHMGAVDYQGFPQRYRLRANTIQDSATSTPYPEQDAEGGFDDEGDDDSLQAGPGTVWDLSGTAKVGQFDAADAKNFLESINFYARVMGATSGTPLRFMDPTGDVPSGESLRADDAPLTEKIGDRQVWLGDEMQNALQFALRVAGIEVPKVKVDWKPVQIVDDLQGWQTVKTKVEAGVPQEVALAEAGYRPEEVQSWLKGSETTNLATRVALVGQIAAAMQGLGSAVALGVITQEQVQAVVAELLGDSTEQEDVAA